MVGCGKPIPKHTTFLMLAFASLESVIIECIWYDRFPISSDFRECIEKARAPRASALFAFNKRETDSTLGTERSLNINIGLGEIPKTPLRPLGSDLPETRQPREIMEN